MTYQNPDEFGISRSQDTALYFGGGVVLPTVPNIVRKPYSILYRSEYFPRIVRLVAGSRLTAGVCYALIELYLN